MFSGLCIGGPKAGARVDAVGPSFRTPVLQDCGATYTQSEAPPASAPAVETIRYVHFNMFGAGTNCFWLPEKSPPGYLMDELMKAYEAHHKE